MHEIPVLYTTDIFQTHLNIDESSEIKACVEVIGSDERLGTRVVYPSLSKSGSKEALVWSVDTVMDGAAMWRSAILLSRLKQISEMSQELTFRACRRSASPSTIKAREQLKQENGEEILDQLFDLTIPDEIATHLINALKQNMLHKSVLQREVTAGSIEWQHELSLLGIVTPEIDREKIAKAQESRKLHLEHIQSLLKEFGDNAENLNVVTALDTAFTLWNGKMFSDKPPIYIAAVSVAYAKTQEMNSAITRTKADDTVGSDDEEVDECRENILHTCAGWYLRKTTFHLRVFRKRRIPQFRLSQTMSDMRSIVEWRINCASKKTKQLAS